MRTKTKQNRIMRNFCNGLLPKRTGKTVYGGIDEFINRLAAMKEQGNLFISGKRIC